MLSIQVIGLRMLAIQAQRYFEEQFSVGTQILRTSADGKRQGDSVSEMRAAARRTR